MDSILLKNEERIINLINKSRDFRKKKDKGLVVGDMLSIIELSEDNIDLFYNIYDIAYRRGYQRAKREIREKAKSEG